MNTSTAILNDRSSDADLVAGSLSGNRDAFGQIVARYQSLICSLAYSSTGSLSQSEDLAQETFVTAWTELKSLREPAKLRSWLCKIARHHIYDTLIEQKREPSHAAESLEVTQESCAPEPLPIEQVISKEQEEILWRSIEKMPELYREPLILFYREHKSIESVASGLGLSEDNVKQRLSRGRKLLHREVIAFVENALGQTAPGKSFTLAVLASLPLATTSAKAAVIGTAAVKGSAVAKSAGQLAVFNAILVPVFVGAATYFGYRLDRDSARSPERKEVIVRYYRHIAVCVGVFLLAMLSLIFLGRPLAQSNPTVYIGLLAGLAVGYFIAAGVITYRMRRSLRKLRQEETARHQFIPAMVPVFEYRTKTQLLGLPLVHIRIRGGLERGPVKAWIAAGDGAIGALFAFGGYAIAPISFGGAAIGLLPLGGFALGLAAFGGFCLGIWAFGGFAAGWQAVGGCAVGWDTALGGVALAHDYASGAIAHAMQANSDAARASVEASRFCQLAQVFGKYLAWLSLAWLLPLILWLRARTKRQQQ